MENGIWILIGLGFPFAMTIAGAAIVLFFRKSITAATERLLMGLAAGIMMAASFWSLLEPAIERAEQLGIPPALPAGVGVFAGAASLCLIQMGTKQSAFVTAMVLHNIPEGMVVGLGFAAAIAGLESYSSALAMAFGIGIQNIPEGAAVAFPFVKRGMGRKRACAYGGLSGIVEPVFGGLVMLAAQACTVMMPWLLAFAAGAMIYVTVEELLPEAQGGYEGSTGFMGGFLCMMLLDVILG